MIREATMDDLNDVGYLVAAIHQKTSHGHVPVRVSDFAACVRACVEAEHGVVLLAVNDAGVTVGLLALMSFALNVNSGYRVVNDACFFAREAGHSADLISAAQDWTRRHGFNELTIGVDAALKPDVMERMLRPHGFNRSVVSFTWRPGDG